MADIGLTVQERTGVQQPVISGAVLNKVAVMVKSQLGPENKAISITSLSQFKNAFGPPVDGEYGYHVVKGIFQNADPAGPELQVVRPVSSSGTASSHQESQNAGSDTLTFTAGYLGDDSTGAEGDNTKVEITSFGSNWRVNVYRNEDGVDQLKETFDGVTESNIESKINGNSQFVTVSITSSFSLSTLSGLSKTALSGGADPSYPSDLSSSDFDTLDNKTLSLVTSSDWHSTTSASAIESYCAGRNDCMGVVAVPFGTSVSNVNSSYSTNLLQSRSFLAAYYNWITVGDSQEGADLDIPPVGHVIGTYYLRKNEAEGGYAHIPPAGLNYSMRGVRDVEREINQTQLNTLVREDGVNPITFYKGYGNVVRTSRTLSTTNKYYSVHVRRSLNFLVESFKNSLGSFEQKPNNPETRETLRSSLNSFLTKQYQNGMFQTEGGFDNNVKITCDESNNPASVRENRELVADVAVRIVAVAESVIINLTSVNQTTDISEV